MKTIIKTMENAGCNNGNYPEYKSYDDKGNIIREGITCRCGNGCSDTDPVYGEIEYADELE